MARSSDLAPLLSAIERHLIDAGIEYRVGDRPRRIAGATVYDVHLPKYGVVMYLSRARIDTDAYQRLVARGANDRSEGQVPVLVTSLMQKRSWKRALGTLIYKSLQNRATAFAEDWTWPTRGIDAQTPFREGPGERKARDTE